MYNSNFAARNNELFIFWPLSLSLTRTRILPFRINRRQLKN